MKQRIFTLILALTMIISCLPVSAAESISDGGSTYVTIEKGHYGSYLRTTDGNKIGARNWIYKTNDGITGPGYCVNYNLTAVDSSTRLTIAGLFTSSPQTAGAFASGYPQRTLDEFMEIYLADYPELAGLTENEFANATQFAIWATLGQLAIEGTDFTTGRSTIPVQYDNAQNVRIYRAIQIILNNAKNWDRIYKKGLSIRQGLSEIGSDVIVENTDGIAGAAKDGQNGIKIETINGTEYYTREFVASSATSTWKHGYCIEIWPENAPEGTIFTDLDNKILETTVWEGQKLYKVPTAVRVTNLNDNGSEYYGQFKICMPVRATPENGTVYIRATSTVSQFDLYLANNTNQTEQSYIIADPAYASVRATGALKWNKVVTPYGKLILQKVDGYGQSLSGAVFKLTGADGSSFTGTSDERGQIVWEYLNPDVQYTLEEIQPPEGYIKAENQIVSVPGGQTLSITVQNKSYRTARIRKVDAQSGASLKGAAFRIESIDGGFKTDAVTSHDGYIELTADELPFGTYKVYEVSAPDGYEPAKDAQTFKWDGTEDVMLTFENVRKTTLTVIKVDAETDIALEGAVFDVYRDGQKVTSVKTDNAGYARISGVSEGYYEIVETKAPEGYLLDSKRHGVYVNPYNPAMEEDPTFIISNSRKPTLIIEKLDSTALRPMKGTTFAVYKDTTLIGEYTTDSDGLIELTDLEPGTYTEKEIATDNEHIVNSTPQSIELTKDSGDRAILVFLNDQKPYIRLVKLDTETMEPLANAVFKFKKVGGNFEKEYTTDETGEIKLENLATGSYTVTEIKAPDGYLIDDSERIINIDGNEYATFVFTNTRKPSLKVLKYDAYNDKYLPGATFRVARIEDGSNYLDRVTDISGSIEIDNLEPGVYSVKEIEAQSGYVLNSTEYHVELFGGKQSRLVVINEEKPSLKIVKTDALTGEPISGVGFLVRKAEGETENTVVTNENGEAILTHLDTGIYEVIEKSVPEGYLLNSEPKLVTLAPNRTSIVRFENYPKPSLTINKVDAITKDGLKGAKFHILYASNNTFTGETSSITWYNTPTQAQIQIVKKSADDNPINGLPAGSLLEGATFEIYDRGGNIVDTIKTDKNGRAASKTLPLGLYTVRETIAPAYYAVNETVMTANLEFSGQIITFEVLDKSVSTGVSITKRGYNEVMPDNPIVYTFTGIANTSSIPLESFYWRDTLPGAIRAEKLVTGTYNRALSYKIVYLTNLSNGEYRTINDNLSTSRNYALDISNVALGQASNEYITEIMFVFGTVPAGFSQVETPYLYARSIQGLPNGVSFVNQADAGGVYNGQWITSVSRWVTKVYNYTHFVMPKTGY